MATGERCGSVLFAEQTAIDAANPSPGNRDRRRAERGAQKTLPSPRPGAQHRHSRPFPAPGPLRPALRLQGRGSSGADLTPLRPAESLAQRERRHRGARGVAAATHPDRLSPMSPA